MKKNLYWMAAAFITLTAVGCTNAKKADVSAAGSDTVQVADMHTAETSLDYYGVYKGTVPAADCPGIELTLTLKRTAPIRIIGLILTVKMPISMKPVRLR